MRHILVSTENEPGIEEASIKDDYAIFADGTALITNVQIHKNRDGTSTHVITVRGIRGGYATELISDSEMPSPPGYIAQYECEGCKDLFDTRTDLDRHMHRDHMGTP